MTCKLILNVTEVINIVMPVVPMGKVSKKSAGTPKTLSTTQGPWELKNDNKNVM